MADDTGSSQETKDQLDLPVSSRKNARKKIRPTYSCLSCHKRKVKVLYKLHTTELLKAGQGRLPLFVRFRLAD